MKGGGQQGPDDEENVIQPVILCGGSGTRLWPLSREHHPKPLHALNGVRTLLQETLARSGGIEGSVQPLVICNEMHRFMVAEQLGRIDRKSTRLNSSH